VLSRLHVVHYALIEEVEIDFDTGLNIITGETGAGKSILVGALSLVLGARANADVIRTGQDRCLVEAIFEFPEGHASLVALAEQGIDVDEGQLILRREVTREGRSRCFANGLSIPVKSLQSLGKVLVDLHGQHDHQSLLDAGRHIGFLDGYAGLAALGEQVHESYSQIERFQRKLSGLMRESAQRADRRELLSFQITEISAIAPQPGEDEALELERSRLENAERLIDSATQLEQMLYQGDDSIADCVGKAQRILGDVTRVDESLEEKSKELSAIGYEVDELARFFSHYAQEIEHNPERLASVIDRLEQISRLKSKYGGDLNAVLAYAEEAGAELKVSESSESEQSQLGTDLEVERKSFEALCFKLSAAREKAGKKLSKGVVASLSELGMSDVRFEITFEREADPGGLVERDGQRYVAGPDGAETAEFYLSTNPGESPKPLVRVASGGEISRIMLALKSVLAQTDSVQVLIFDEIDVGISGRIAEVVGRRLKHLADQCQTVSITHLPQIAKMADRHFSVRKETDGSRTETYVARLEADDRVEELARLLGGEEISPLTREHAKEMLAVSALPAANGSKPADKTKRKATA
jgi:DNA repair protein RecN (Recombination protein N)